MMSIVFFLFFAVQTIFGVKYINSQLRGNDLTKVASVGDVSQLSQMCPSGMSNNKRLVTFLESWDKCPTDEQVSYYSYIVIASAVSVSFPRVREHNLLNHGVDTVCMVPI